MTKDIIGSISLHNEVASALLKKLCTGAVIKSLHPDKFGGVGIVYVVEDTILTQHFKLAEIQKLLEE